MGTMTISPQLPGAVLPIDPSKELVPVVNMAGAQHALVVTGTSPWRSLADLVNAAKAQPGAVSYATAGAGSGQQLSGAWLAQATGAEMVGVPYRGMAPAMPDIIAGRTGFAITNIGDVAGQVASGEFPAAGSGKRQRLAALSPCAAAGGQYPRLRCQWLVRPL